MRFSHLLSLIALSLSVTLSSAQEAEDSARILPFPIPPILLPPVDSRKLQRLVKKDALVRHVKQLESFAKANGGNRAFGSKGHNATINYIKKLIDDTHYYDTYLQTFPYTYSESSSQFTADGKAYLTRALFYAPSGNVTAPLVALEAELGCAPESFPPTVQGKLVLIKRGDCTYGVKVALAGAAKAAGVIIYNDVEFPLNGGSLGGPSRPEGPYVPVGTISGIDGLALRATLASGVEVVGILDAYGLVEERYSSNLIATTKHGDKNKIVFSGAHSDSVPAGPGINDDGSGTIGNLEVALQLSKFRVNNAVRFGWWTAEEFGLVGSSYHVRNLPQSERDKIALYLNYDMIASSNYGYLIYDGDGDTFQRPGPAGSAQIEHLFEGFYRDRKLISTAANFTGRSDYGPFLEYGIPAGGVTTGSDRVKTPQEAEWWGGQAGAIYEPCYHIACDTVSNMRTDVFEVNAQAIAHGIATYAKSLTGIPFPRPKGVSANRVLSVDTLSYEERVHYGCGDEHEVSWQ